MIWYVEKGIGEDRLIGVENGKIALAKLDWHGELVVGERVAAKITRRWRDGNRAIATTDAGQTILLSRLPKEATEGASVAVEVLRAPIHERGRSKPAHGFLTEEPERRWRLTDRFRHNGHEISSVARFPISGWTEIIQAAFDGLVEFDGGSLQFSPTPAMTLIDIDGTLSPTDLALAAVDPLVDALSRFQLYGSIGIDFPTLTTKAARKTIDDALNRALRHYPAERTAMNGFGFVQLVARLDGPSILHRAHFQPVRAAMQLLLRKAERVEEPGALLLTANPRLAEAFREEWRADLGRRTGREIRVETDPTLALESGFAQAVPL